MPSQFCFRHTALCALVFGLLAVPALAAVPSAISVDGALLSNTGGPAADGVYKLTFKLYKDSFGGAALWSEGPVSLPVGQGGFHHAPAATDVAKYPDCTLPQTKGCPCSTAELGTHCCVKVTDGLTCSKKYVDGTLIWQAFADCCRDPGHGCENINPKPTPPWCNGKIP